MSHLIGDPTPIGWTITLAFGLAAFLSWRAAFEAREAPTRACWLVLALGATLLGLNKQLDLQVPLNDAGGQLARRLGWYEHRMILQVVFVLALGTSVSVILGIVARRARPWSRPLTIGLVGAAILALHLFVRAASFDVYDVRRLIGGVNFYPVLELLGSSILALGAWIELEKGDGRAERP